MPIYCHVCASTKGPFLKERIPAGITSHQSIIRCQSCASTYYAGVTVANKATCKENFAYWFWECSKCGALFYSVLEGVPCAQSHFEVDNCPQCGSPFPTVDEVCIHRDDNEDAHVLSFTKRALTDIKPLFDKVVKAVPRHPNLVDVIREIMLVKASELDQYDIWVIHVADSRGREIISHILQKAMEEQFVSTGSRLLRFAKKEKGLKVFESIKICKEGQKKEKGKKWWQIWK